MQARIRPYREADEAAVLALWEAAGIDRPWLDLRAEIAEKLRRDRELFLVAEDDSQDGQDGRDGQDGLRRPPAPPSRAGKWGAALTPPSAPLSRSAGEGLGVRESPSSPAGAKGVGGLGQTRLVGAVMGAYDGRRGWVYHLAVAPDRQRQGIGRRLMAALEEAMAAAGISKVNLQVRADNAVVVGFYEKLGYVDEHLTSLAKRLRQ